MTWVRELIHIPERVHRGDFVLKLTEGVSHAEQTLQDYVVTPQLVQCFDNSGVAPLLFLKKLVADVLDRVDQFPDFDPREHYTLTIAGTEMTLQERAATGANAVDDIEL